MPAEQIEAESEFWIGLACDHLYENCPLRIRSLPSLKLYGWDNKGRGTVDVFGTDICGWCLRVWKGRNHAAA